MNLPATTTSSSGGNFLTKALARVTTSLTQMRHAAQSLFFGGLLKRTRFDYAREVGDMLDASVVMAPVMWLQRALPEATLAMRERLQGGKVQPVEEHPLLELIRHPNPHYGDIALWNGVIADFCLWGDAYLLKVRDLSGTVRELWYVPQFMMEPKAGLDGTEFLSHYWYTPGTGYGRIPIDPADVIHFRNGLNPRDLRRGYAWFGVAMSNFVGGLSYSSVIDVRIMRGVTGSFNDQRLNGYCIVGCDIAAGRIEFAFAERGALIYSNTLTNPPGGTLATIGVICSANGLNYGGVAVVQNLAVRVNTGGDPNIRVAGDSDPGNLTHFVCHHNTTPGVAGFGRWNVVYDETGSTARTHILVSFKGNLGPQLNTKGDVFMTNGARIGNFPFHHGVGCAGVFAEGLDSAGGGLSFGQAYAGVNSVINGGAALYVDNRAVTAGPVAGTTGGNYRLQSGSPAKNLFSEYLLGFDIAGNPRPTSGMVDAGCYA